MIATDERLGRKQPREEFTRRAKQDFPADPRVETEPVAPKTPRGATGTAEQMPSANTPTVLQPRGGDADEDEDMAEYEGFPDMSSDSEDEAAARCPVPDSESDSDSDMALGRSAVPQDRVVAHAEAVTQSRGGGEIAG